MTDDPPAPLSLVELSVCNNTTLWNNNCCKCFKNNLPCTDMCKCICCQNEGESENYKFDKKILIQFRRGRLPVKFMCFFCFKNHFIIITC